MPVEAEPRTSVGWVGVYASPSSASTAGRSANVLTSSSSESDPSRWDDCLTPSAIATSKRVLSCGKDKKMRRRGEPTPKECWEALLRPVTSVSFEPADPEGFRKWQGHPALLFLGAPSEFAPENQARFLQKVRQQARMAGGYYRVRHSQIGLYMIKREECATDREGNTYRLTSTWVEDPGAKSYVSVATQTEPVMETHF